MSGFRARIEPMTTAVLVALSWLGMVIHNRAEFPGMSFIRPEYVFPTLVSIGLYLLWYLRREEERIWSWCLLGWATIHLVIGAWLSVMPLPIWPFVPEQSVGHYLSHVIYGALQIPLMGYLVVKLEWKVRVDS
jgi:hypothetical protein